MCKYTMYNKQITHPRCWSTSRTSGGMCRMRVSCRVHLHGFTMTNTASCQHWKCTVYCKMSSNKFMRNFQWKRNLIQFLTQTKRCFTLFIIYTVRFWNAMATEYVWTSLVCAILYSFPASYTLTLSTPSHSSTSYASHRRKITLLFTMKLETE